MSPKKILTLVGGISKNSLNQKLFRTMKDLAPEGYELESFDIQHLPFFSQDLENDPPDIVEAFKDAIRNADAVLLITPEYNRSFPAVIKNALDWGSRPYLQNLWDKKIAAMVGASPGNIGTFGAQHHLRQVMAYLNMLVMGQPEVYLKSSGVFDEKSHEFLVKFWIAFSEWIELQMANQDAHLVEHQHKNLDTNSNPYHS